MECSLDDCQQDRNYCCDCDNGDLYKSPDEEDARLQQEIAMSDLALQAEAEEGFSRWEEMQARATAD